MKVSRETFEDLVAEALDSIPPQFEPYMEGLAVDIEAMPDTATLADLDLDDAGSLLGLYRGVPLPDRSVEHMFRMPDSIVIYQHNIERLCRTRAQIVQQIRKTILHEVGHHFGMDEDELDEIGFG